jgi:hypothetical protein
MKRTICMVGISLYLVSMVLAGCASMAPVQKTKLSTSDLSALTGTWQGWSTFKSYQSPIMTTIEITNSTIPIQGKVIFPDVSPGAAAALPGAFTTAGSNTLEFSTGRITDQGTLIATGTGSNFVEFTYYAGAKPKLEGWFYYYGASGTLAVSR